MRATLKDIAYYLPSAVVTNEDLMSENPAWELRRLQNHSGILQRHIAAENETALDLAHIACERLFDKNRHLRDRVDGIIFCTQSPDHIIPPNACILHQRLGLQDEVFAFDINHACSGYIYGLALAQGMLLAGRAQQILLINADTYSKYLHPQDRSARTLFGDGAAVTWLAAAQDQSGLIDILCATRGQNYASFYIPAGACRLRRPAQRRQKLEEDRSVSSAEYIHIDGIKIMELVLDKVPRQIHALLQRNGLTMDQIKLLIFHQANNFVLESLRESVKIPAKKIYKNFAEIGNTVSASIPIALHDAISDGTLQKGDLLLLSGFGSGFSWGSALLKY